MTDTELAHACRRLLAVDREIRKIPSERTRLIHDELTRINPADFANVAHALLKILLRKKRAKSRNQVAKYEEWRREATRKALGR